MSREKRKTLIEEIEKLRGSKVLTYVTGDRAPAGAQMGNDAVRYLYDHVRAVGKVDQIDLFVYSHGGDINVPWRIASALRTAAETWNLLAPLSANSAATLLALGADEIVLGPQAELGPIDPQITEQQGPGGQNNVGVEDVMAYVKFVTERAGLSDQAALAASVAKLAERLDPVALGQIYRTHSHIREVAGQMLRSRKSPASEQTMATIIETLAERVYAHGHAIGFRDAEDMGLPVQQAEGDLDKAMWALLREYESELKTLDPIDPRAAIDSSDQYEEPLKLGAIESTWGLHEFSGTLLISAQRQVPPQLAVNMNMNLQLPQPPQQLPPDVQQFLQQVMQALQQQIADSANQAVQDAMQTQAPLMGAEVTIKEGCWKLVDAADDGE